MTLRCPHCRVGDSARRRAARPGRRAASGPGRRCRPRRRQWRRRHRWRHGDAVGQLTRQPVLGREGHAVRLRGQRWIERRIARSGRDERGRGGRRPAAGRACSRPLRSNCRSGRVGACSTARCSTARCSTPGCDAGRRRRPAPAVVVPAPASVAVPLDGMPPARARHRRQQRDLGDA